MNKKNNSRVSEETYREYANNWRPDNVKVLMVAESPPPKGEDETPYIYNPDSQEKGGLWEELADVLLDKDDVEKEEFLKEFKKRGYFLIDIFATYEEKERFDQTEYSGKRRKILNRLLNWIKETNPENFVFIHKRAARCLSLPFPVGRSKAHAPEFKEGLTNILSGEGE